MITKEMQKIINRFILVNLPCMAYMLYVLGYSHSFDVMMYRSNYVIILFAIVNLLFFIIGNYHEYMNGRITKNIARITSAIMSFTALIVVSYYATMPLILYKAIDGHDKNITTVIFDKTEYPDLAKESVAQCKNTPVCYINVEQFRANPTHGTQVQLSISPVKNYTIILNSEMSNVYFVLNNVILRKDLKN